MIQLLKISFFIWAFLVSSFAFAKTKPFPPIPSDFIYNDSSLISKSEEERLSNQLSNFREKTGYALAVALFSSLDGEDIDDYTNRLYRHWCGKEEKSCAGLLIVVAEQERRYRTEVGYGLEGRITDLLVSRAHSQLLRPMLRENRTYKGLSLLAERYSEILTAGGEGQSSTDDQRTYKYDQPNMRGHLPVIILLFIVIVIAHVIRAVRSIGGRGLKRRRRGWWMGGGDGWGGGFGGGGFGGGGGGGFGGFSGGSSGSSGGGGASGSW